MVHIVDDDPFVRKGLTRLVASEGIRAKAYESAERFLEHYVPHKPECLVLDLRLPGMDGMTLNRELRDLGIVIPTLFLTAYGDIRMAVQAVREGAMDFIEKPFEKEHLLGRIRRAIQVDAGREQARVEEKDAAERLSRLTRREREVVDLLVQGRINKVIAGDLGISMRTVESHRRRIMKKTNVDSAAELFKLVALGERDRSDSEEA